MLKRRLRLNKIYGFRENYIKNLQSNKDNASIAKLKFIKKRKETPNNVCACCETLWFSNSVINLATTKRHSKLGNDVFSEKIINDKNTNKICKTCDRNIRHGKIPKLATSNGLKFPFVDDSIKNLTDLEAVMVAPIIAFKQIRPLKPHTLNPQLSLKGCVVFIESEVKEVIEVLPRNFNEMDVTQIKFKRHVSHKSDYMNEIVRPGQICKALNVLLQSPLYKEYGIKINNSFFKKYENNYDVKLDFVVEEEDKDLKQNVDIHKLEVLEDGDGKISYAINSDSNSDGSDNEDDIVKEVLLVSRNAESAKEAQILAPGQDKKPISFTTPHADALANPKIFAGHDFTAEISLTSRIKSEIRRSDRRSCEPKRLLDLANQKIQNLVSANINVFMKLIKTNAKLTAEKVLSAGFVYDAIRHDVGYKVLKQIRLTPAYLAEDRKKIFAFIRNKGKPTFFFTLSAAERWWPELMQMLAKVLDNKTLTLEEALNIEDNTKTDYIRRDPVTCALYFDFKFRAMLNYLGAKAGPFGKYCLEDYYYRIEFQLRGSPHAHCFLWLKDAPDYDESGPKSRKKCIEFIDQFITCQYVEENPFMAVQRHKHTHTCNKGEKNKIKCRFDYPIPVMPKTMILDPLEETDDKIVEKARNNLKEIRKLMHFFYKKQCEMVEFNKILEKLDLTEDEYILAIRSSIKRTRIFLKRKSTEVGINCYNLDILNLFEANMDIQFVLNPYSCAAYIVNYISKVDSGLSKLLRQAVEEVNSGNSSIKERLRNYCNAFLNGNLMSAQEAAYQVLSLVVAKGSRKVVFINTSAKNERARMLKSEQELRLLDANSEDVLKNDYITKYESRPHVKANVCLADFVAFSKSNKKHNASDDSDNDSDEEKERDRPLII